MSGVSLDVPGRSTAQIGEIAAQVRGSFRWVADRFPIVQVLEFGIPTLWPDYTFEVFEVAEMPGEHGLTYPDEKRVVIRQDVYEGALAGNGRDRFTCAHELGHLLMHANLGFARHVRRGDVPAYRDSEWQANTFAGALLIPKEAVSRGETPHSVSERFGVSLDAASVTLKKYGLWPGWIRK